MYQNYFAAVEMRARFPWTGRGRDATGPSDPGRMKHAARKKSQEEIIERIPLAAETTQGRILGRKRVGGFAVRLSRAQAGAEALNDVGGLGRSIGVPVVYSDPLRMKSGIDANFNGGHETLRYVRGVDVANVGHGRLADGVLVRVARFIDELRGVLPAQSFLTLRVGIYDDGADSVVEQDLAGLAAQATRDEAAVRGLVSILRVSFRVKVRGITTVPAREVVFDREQSLRVSLDDAAEEIEVVGGLRNLVSSQVGAPAGEVYDSMWALAETVALPVPALLAAIEPDGMEMEPKEGILESTMCIQSSNLWRWHAKRQFNNRSRLARLDVLEGYFDSEWHALCTGRDVVSEKLAKDVVGFLGDLGGKDASR